MCISGPLWHSPDDVGHMRQGHLFHESAFPEVEHLVTDGGWCKWKKKKKTTTIYYHSVTHKEFFLNAHI